MAASCLQLVCYISTEGIRSKNLIMNVCTARHAICCLPSAGLCRSPGRHLRGRFARSIHRDPHLYTLAGKCRQPAVAAASTNAAVTVKQAVEHGLERFKARDYQQALQLFQKALDSDPRPEEAQAALYNAACCQVKLKQWQAATESVAEAVNNYQLKLKVAMEDRDLAPLRERREWRDAVETMQGGLSRQSLVAVRAEQKSPFRLLRLLLSGGFGAGALVGLFIISGRLVGALKGGEGAPALQETLQNLAINGAAVAVLGAIFLRDIKGQQKDRTVIEREEKLARLQVKVGKDRVVTLETLRGSSRPVLVSGSRGQVSRALKAAAPYQEALRERGISMIPLRLSQDDQSEKLAALKAELRPSKGFGKQELSAAAATSQKDGATTSGRQFELEPYNADEWKDWLTELKQAANVTGDHLYVQVQLDGSVRSSGIGAPQWQRLCDQLPALDSFQTRITDGLRR